MKKESNNHATKKVKQMHHASLTNTQLVLVGLFFAIILPVMTTIIVTKTNLRLGYNNGDRQNFQQNIAKKSAVITFKVNGATHDDAKNSPLRPEPGNTFAVVDVTLKNNSDSTVHVSPLTQSYVQDDNGNRYKIIAVIGHKEPVAGPLEAGKEITGSIGYEVPATAKNLVFHYDALSKDDSPINEHLSL